MPQGMQQIIQAKSERNTDVQYALVSGSEWGEDDGEGSILVPELRLTMPTPELGESVVLRSLEEEESRVFVINDIPDGQSMEGQTLAPAFSEVTSPLHIGVDSSVADLRALALNALENLPNYTLEEISSRRDSRTRSSVHRHRRSSTLPWSFLRYEKKHGKSKRVWTRFSRVLANLTGLSVDRQTRHGSTQLKTFDDENGPIDFLGDLLPVAISQDGQSDSELAVVSSCVLEEGEHTSSRLFGLPNNRRASVASTGKTLGNIAEANCKTRRRRHSFGFIGYLGRRALR